MKDIDKLKDIFLADNIDSEDYQDNLDKITEWEKDLIENENMVSWQEHELTGLLIEQVKESYIEISVRLARERYLSDKVMNELWAKQDAMMWLMSLTEGDPKLIIENIEKDIRKALKP